MGIIGQTISQALPTPNDPINFPGPLFATMLKDFLDEVKARLEANITPSSMTINAALNLANNSLRNASFVELDDRTVTAGINTSIEAIAGELYFTDGTGASVKLTNSGAINVATVQGLTGDYGTGDEELIYTTSGTLYEFKDGAGAGDYAEVKANTFQSVAGMTVGTTLTTVDATVTGDITLTGSLIRGVINRLISGVDGSFDGSGGAYVLNEARSFVNWNCSVPVAVGETIDSVRIYLYDSDTVGTWNWYLKRVDRTTGSVTTVASGSGTHPSAGVWASRDLSSLAESVSGGDNAYFVQVTSPGASSNHRCGGFRVGVQEV